MDKNEFLKAYNLTKKERLEIIEQLSPDTIEDFVLNNFRAKNVFVYNNWTPTVILLDFIKRKKQTTNLTANQLGRFLKKINAVSRYNHCKELGRTCSGYYVDCVDNILNYELLKFKRDYAFR